MSYQCTHCTLRGDIKTCLVTECGQHESWFAKTILTQMKELESDRNSWRDQCGQREQDVLPIGAERDRLADAPKNVLCLGNCFDCGNEYCDVSAEPCSSCRTTSNPWTNWTPKKAAL